MLLCWEKYCNKDVLYVLRKSSLKLAHILKRYYEVTFINSIIIGKIRNWNKSILIKFTSCKTVDQPGYVTDNSRPCFYLWKIKLLYLFLHLLIQIWSQNHNCNVLNVFLIVFSIVLLIVLWPYSQWGPLSFMPLSWWVSDLGLAALPTLGAAPSPPD